MKKFHVKTSDAGGKDEWEYAVACPFCDYGYVHIEKPQFLEGHDNYEARGDVVRGDCIIIPMYCENGHSWNTVFGFHKGITFVWVEKYTGSE